MKVESFVIVYWLEATWVLPTFKGEDLSKTWIPEVGAIAGGGHLMIHPIYSPQ